jgi:hypothetical protein
MSLGVALIGAVWACSSTPPATSGDGGSVGVGGTGGASGAATGSIAGYCDESCTKVHECDSTKDLQTCTNNCSNANAATGPKLRSDFTGYLTTCVQSKDCVSVLNGAAFGACSDEAVAILAPSAVGADFCTKYEAAASRCNSTFDKAACFNKAKTFNDPALTGADACFDKACADITDCVKAALGDIKSGSTSSGADGGPGTGAGGSRDSGAGGSRGPGAGGASVVFPDGSVVGGGDLGARCGSDLSQGDR